MHKESREVCGYPRVHKVLQQAGIVCGKNRVARLMRENGIAVRMAR
ncbi:MAG: IS3 family transposase [Candidatus Thiodiazotropha sp. (ex Codakia rugifera)]|nr:IS3 family transposase [Candidatus Thiodiazotropha sp. (ex Codakia rugifera)]